MKSEGEDGDGQGTLFANQRQGSQDRPSAGIPAVRERESDQGTLGVVTTRLTSERPATRGANQKGWPRTEISGRLLWTAYAPGGAMGLDRQIDRYTNYLAN